ncbi:SDR family oxidoreductase [bacterium 1XD42-1]|nr:SDR family oxidoreductase [bacterium 1XD42-8]RKJ64613.1 SDR family oxidoreductase [bacterium 1XD42-1]
MLKGKNAVITGARRGIGRATVEVFAQNGANIWACARKKDTDFEKEIDELAKYYNVWIEPVYFDFMNGEEIKQGVKQIQAKKQSVCILVNNAGMVANSTSFSMMSMKKLQDVFTVNFFSQMLLTQYISRLMMRQKTGAIVNLASVAALDGEPAQLEYVSSKAALIGATKNLAVELGKYGIRVNAVAPGIIDTDMGNEIQSELMNRILSNTVMKRKGLVQEIANVIAFLASDQASFITGQILRVDGGL